jgi:hypothetical protein
MSHGTAIDDVAFGGAVVPLLIVFAPGARLLREPERPSHFRIHRNGPAGTFVLFDTLRVSLPTDQVVLAEEADGTVTVGFGGFRFDGMRDGRLFFSRVRDLLPDSELSPDRSWTMTLDPEWVSEIHTDGVHAWPGPSA